jgi:four helix bundle protein
MALQVKEFSIEVIAALRPLVPRIRRHDRSLADQLLRAASSVVLNIAEGEHSDPGNRRARFYTAAGSANETLAALRVAVAWGYFAGADAEAAAGMLRRVIAMLWKLTRGGASSHSERRAHASSAAASTSRTETPASVAARSQASNSGLACAGP